MCLVPCAHAARPPDPTCAPSASARTRTSAARRPARVQQNEIARENKFYAWTVTRRNLPGLLLMTLVFPGAYHYLHKEEQMIRDVKMRGIKAREYY